MIRCACRRGWIQTPTGEWADPCPECKGKGTLSIGAIAKLLHEDRRNLWNLIQDRPQKATTTARLCRKLCDALDRQQRIPAPPEREGA